MGMLGPWGREGEAGLAQALESAVGAALPPPVFVVRELARDMDMLEEGGGNRESANGGKRMKNFEKITRDTPLSTR